MPRLPFRPDADGFAFPNSFTFDSSERAVLGGLAALAGGAVATLVPLVGPALVPVVAGAAAGYAALGPLPGYGLCGGMCYGALDYWHARLPPPRGADENDVPLRSGPGAGVRSLLWSRLLDSLIGGGVLTTTLIWMLRLNVLPGLLGGGRWLKEQTQAEWVRLKSHIDQSQPWPIGLVGTTLAAWNQHQVVVYGYESTSTGVNLFVYDPNDPKQVLASPAETVLSVDFSIESNAEVSGSSLNPSNRKGRGVLLHRVYTEAG
jgi:hypothetical protein